MQFNNKYFANKLDGYIINKDRFCSNCGNGILVEYDESEGELLYMCSECNSQEVIVDGKKEFLKIFEEDEDEVIYKGDEEMKILE